MKFPVKIEIIPVNRNKNFMEEMAMAYVPTVLRKEIVIDSVITIHYFEYTRDFVFKGEKHDFWEFLYVDKGQVSVCQDDTWHNMSRGEIIFHKPNEFHAIRSMGKESINLVVMSFKTRSPAIKFFENRIGLVSQAERQYISLLIQEAKEAFSTPLNEPAVEQVRLREDAVFAAQQMILLYLEMFLISFYRGGQQQLAETAHPHHQEVTLLHTERDSRFEEICNYLEFRICDRLTVSDLTRHFSVSRSMLQALFHEETGAGIMDYFAQLKIKRAKEIIRDGNMNLTEIAYFLSYSSLPSFSKQFKKITGMPPMAYASSVKKMTEDLSGDHSRPR